MKIINNLTVIMLSMLTMLMVFSCTHDHADDGHVHADGTSHGMAEGHPAGEIHLTTEQIKTMGIEFGNFSEMKINDYVNATGVLGLPSNAYASVSAKAPGFVKGSNKFMEGDFIKKEQRVAYLENPEFIKQQQTYLEVAAELNYLQKELERQQGLVNANAGILKNVQKLESEVQLKNATLKGVAKQLFFWGIKAESLTAEKIIDKISILSPMSGYITTVNIHDGMYVEPQDELLEIVSDKHLHLELDVFEKDLAQVKEGQRISYTVPALGQKIYEGEVHVIGKEFNSENKTIRIHGHLGKERPRFVKDLFVEAKIWLNDQTVQALPEQAIVQDGSSSCIFVANRKNASKLIFFEKIMIVPGTADDGFVAVKLIDEVPAGMDVVTQGAYYVYAQSKAGELEHSH